MSNPSYDDEEESDEHQGNQGANDDLPPIVHTANDLVQSDDIIMKPHQHYQDQSSNSPWISSSSEKFSSRIRRSPSPPPAAPRPALTETDRASREFAKGRNAAPTSFRRTRRQASTAAEMDRILALRALLGDAGSSYPYGGTTVVKRVPLRSRVAAGMRYAGIGKRKANSRSKVDAGMRYMGIGKRDY